MSGVAANRLAVKTSDVDDGDVSKVSPRDVIDHVMASARRGCSDVQLCSPQPVDTAWSLLATHGYRAPISMLCHSDICIKTVSKIMQW